jgi:hypothetical protein
MVSTNQVEVTGRHLAYPPVFKTSEEVRRARANRFWVSTAAKAALRRKKQFDHALEQTRGQIMTLESEIYSIETANINKETLDAMKNASAAMKQIHGGLTIDKVDQTMYVHGSSCQPTRAPTLTTLIGKIFENSTPSARKSARPLHSQSETKGSTSRSWTTSSRLCNRKSWTTRCFIPEMYRLRIRSADYQVLQKQVSWLSWQKRHLTIC